MASPFRLASASRRAAPRRWYGSYTITTVSPVRHGVRRRDHHGNGAWDNLELRHIGKPAIVVRDEPLNLAFLHACNQLAHCHTVLICSPTISDTSEMVENAPPQSAMISLSSYSSARVTTQ